MASIMLQNDVSRGGYLLNREILSDNINTRSCELMFDKDDAHVSTASVSIHDGLVVTDNPNEGQKLLRKLPSDFHYADGGAHKISLSGHSDKELPSPTTATTCAEISPVDTHSSLRVRRVIFPWLHSPPESPALETIVEPSLKRTESAPSDRQSKVQPQLPSEILFLLTSPKPRLSNQAAEENRNMCRSSRPTSTRSPRFGIDLESLQIPPFKGVVYPSESSTLATTCLRPASLPQTSILLPNYPANGGPAKPLRSILRSKSDRTGDTSCKQLVDFSSRRSSLPALVSIKDEEDDSQFSTGTVSRGSSSQGLEECPDSDSSFSRSSSRMISFDPRVWVREFQRSEDERHSIWYTPKDLDRFKTYTLTRILEYRGSQFFATGTGRAVQAPTPSSSKAVYANPALTLESEADDLKDEATPFQIAVLECEIRNILIVDPHDICLKLLEKSFKRIIPHANITTVRTSTEALKQYKNAEHPFDIVLTEERLQFFQRQDSVPSPGGTTRIPSSGSSLIRKLLSSHRGNCLFIGITACLEKHQDKFQNSGADIVWSKPPPPMNSNVRETLLKAILLKRGRRALATALYGSEPSS